MLDRKHYCTQELFHAQCKPVKSQQETDQRHAEDANIAVMEYKVEGNDGPSYEAKGLRHDCMAWGIRGNPQVSIEYSI